VAARRISAHWFLDSSGQARVVGVARGRGWHREEKPTAQLRFVFGPFSALAGVEGTNLLRKPAGDRLCTWIWRHANFPRDKLSMVCVMPGSRSEKATPEKAGNVGQRHLRGSNASMPPWPRSWRTRRMRDPHDASYQTIRQPLSARPNG